MIKSLQGLRGMCAVLIFAHHFGFGTGVTEAFGDSCVALFMMLSGFVAGWSATHGRPPRGTAPYMLSRLNRIYPLYLAALAFAVAVKHGSFAPLPLLADAAMVQSWIPDPAFFFSFNGPAWFISDLMLCWLLFVPMWRWIAGNRRSTAKRSIALWCCVTVASLAVTASIPPERELEWVYIFPPMQLASFTGGIAVASVIAGNDIQLHRLTASMFPLAALLLFGALWFVHSHVPSRWGLCAMWWLPSALLIAAFTLCDKSREPLMRLFSSAPMVWLGDISFAFYLLHSPFIIGCRTLMAHAGISMPMGLEFTVVAILLALLSWCATPVFDRITRRLDMRFGLRKPTDRPLVDR